MNSAGLSLKFGVLLVSVMIVALSVSGLWSAYSQRQQAEREMLEKAQILAQEMDAVWTFFETNQHQFKTDQNGNYELYCVIAAKSVSKFFTSETDYVIRYTNLTTRRKADAPDSFEAEAMRAFIDGGAQEHYAISENDAGEQVFRYAQPLFISEPCLECHGDPQGELDSFGYPKEGKKIGDVAGAISIVMPVELYMDGIRAGITSDVVVFGAALLVGLVVIFVGAWRQRAQLERANAVLKESNEFKSEFLATMSHELRTPLTSILAYAEIWERSSAHREEREREAVREVRENGQVLLNMVDNILEVGRSEAGRMKLDIEPVEMVDLCNAIEDRMAFLAQRHSIHFDTVVDSDVPIIMADWDKLRRIIENLVANAIKYTEPGGYVRVEVRLAEGGDGIHIIVRDTGIGIKEENLPYIFEKYTQVDRLSQQRREGSGLGLAVVKELAELHGGSVAVQSVIGGGSMFTVYVPAGDNDWGEGQ